MCIRFCAYLWISAVETLALIRQVFGEESMSCTWVFEWHALFSTGCTSIEYNQHTFRPIIPTTPDSVVKLQQLFHDDRYQTIEDLADGIGIHCGTCQWILTAEFYMHHVAAKFVPRILTSDQKQQHVNVWGALSDCLRWCNLHVQGYQWWWELDLCLWPRDKAAILPMRKSKLTVTEKGEAGEEQSQQHDCHFLSSRGLLTKNSSWQSKQSVLHTAVMCYSDCTKMCKDFALNFNSKRTGCCIMTVHHLTLPFSPGNFSPKTAWLSSRTHTAFLFP
jgi:hypothetical protein